MTQKTALESAAAIEAEWDGRQFDSLGRADKQRYKDRLSAAIRAYLSALGERAEPKVKALREALRKEADAAYCRFLDKMSSRECLGEEAKLQSGKFGVAELNAHREARELLGVHRGIYKALKAFDAALTAQADVGWRLVPVEPTFEMMQAMYEAMFADKWDGTQAPMIGAGYDAALAAAPAISREEA